MSNTPTYRTVRQTAKMGIISEYYLRQMVARGECPGVYTGNRFLINIEKLVEKLDKQSEGARC